MSSSIIWSNGQLVRGLVFYIACITLLEYPLVQALHRDVCFKIHYERYQREQSNIAPKLQLDVSPIKYRDDWLFGWFQVTIKPKSKGNPPGIRYTVMQAMTTTNTIIPGEFFYLKKQGVSDSCGAFQKGSYPNPKKENFLPCLYAADPSPTASYGFSYKPSDKENEGPEEVSATWRVSFPPCGIFDYANPLYFHAYILNPARPFKDGSCNTISFPSQHLITFRNYVGGAYDPPPPLGANIDCTKNLTSLETTDDYPKWINYTDYVDIIPYGSFLQNSECTKTITNEKTELKKEDGKYKPLFYGRCQGYNQTRDFINSTKWSVGPGKQHYCPYTNDYYKQLLNWEDKPRAQGKTCTICSKVNEEYRKKGLSANSAIGKRVHSYRRGHALFMVIATFFFIPISHFVAHFFKETYLTKRILSFHVWYLVHINCSIMAFLALFAAMFAGIGARKFLGYSYEGYAIAHVAIGWIAIILFLFAFLTNSLRREAQPWREVTIFLHYFGGALFYVVALVATILSCYIPASPSARTNVHLSGLKFEFFLIPVFFWIIFDLLVGVALNFCMWYQDRAGVSTKARKWIFFPFLGVPIPKLRPYSKKDYPGTTLRTTLLGVYCVVATGVTVGMIFLLMTNPTAGRFFGRMKFTHKKNGEPTEVPKEFQDTE